MIDIDLLKDDMIIRVHDEFQWNELMEFIGNYSDDPHIIKYYKSRPCLHLYIREDGSMDWLRDTVEYYGFLLGYPITDFDDICSDHSVVTDEMISLLYE